MKMGTGDLKPDLEVTLSSPDEVVDTSTAASIRIIGKQDGEILFDRAPTSDTQVDDTSVVTMEWQAGDTDEPGRITIEVEVTWPGTKPQTFRASGGVDLFRDFDLTD